MQGGSASPRFYLLDDDTQTRVVTLKILSAPTNSVEFSEYERELRDIFMREAPFHLKVNLLALDLSACSATDILGFIMKQVALMRSLRPYSVKYLRSINVGTYQGLVETSIRSLFSFYTPLIRVRVHIYSANNKVMTETCYGGE